MEDALKLEEQIMAEEEVAAQNQDFLRARYVAWAEDKENLELKKDLALVLCRGADPMDKQLAVSYLRECWQAGLFIQESLYAATVSLFALGEFEEAMELCGELISQNPDSPQIRSLHRAIQLRLREKLDRNMEESQRRVAVAGAVGLGVLVAASAVLVAKSLSKRR
mmetsp:Transcript_14625/g.24273  ORF Transcript_14625/g.24273 Transcript_14625/m.24273 type:complete len:166 (+) Transcript_14625:176-673(+)|eukprot:CAMPEP_0114427768 /NCGR_PEP_ID=MMETSP0103-20121206/8546_1 /TAXON_ID=37642 ORGANISM="Paraphysomonas imperforata, Strain PA2" /NCGR_SAMPLE_ID=MMETSP0103 /ASSEMBLY_ACC=CAM_ASM_000201 /LENGTH=165 /DNA_ID=CAMNT_0001596895 /DNA_START=183 /DNA_END=680 /DNA_ORIENTATION=-